MASKMLFHSLALSSLLTLASGSTVTCIQQGSPVPCAPSSTSADNYPTTTHVVSVQGGSPVTTAVASSTATVPPPPTIFATNLTFDRYIALGDSYSAGIKSVHDGDLPACSDTDSDTPCTDYGCARNRGAYGYQFFEAHPPKGFEFLACSGADTQSMMEKQLPALRTPSWVGTYNSTLTTLTIGGNDGDAFSKIVKDCVYLRHGDCKAALDNAMQMLKTIPARVGDVLDKIWTPVDQMNGSKAVVLGYVRFWPRSGHQPAWKCQGTFDILPAADEKAEMNALVDQMNTALSTAAEQRGVLFVDPNAGFEGHRFCDEGEAWFMWDLIDLVNRENGGQVKDADDLERNFPYELMQAFNKGVFHPTQEGQEVYRQSLELVLDRSPRPSRADQ